MTTRAMVLCGILLAAATSAASAALPKELQSFAGSWSCVLKSGGTTYLSSSANAVWGNWIKEEIAFPAQMGQPASVGTAYLGYDAETHRWIYNEVDSVGEYFMTKSESPRLSRSSWTSIYPAGDVSTIRIVSPTQYTIDGRYSENGKTSAFHQACTRK